jgi:hypothetical protein
MTPTVTDIIEQVFADFELFERGEQLSAAETHAATEELNRMMESWAA